MPKALQDVVMTSKNEGEAHVMKGFDGINNSTNSK